MKLSVSLYLIILILSSLLGATGYENNIDVNTVNNNTRNNSISMVASGKPSINTTIDKIIFEQTDSNSTLSWYVEDENPDIYSIYLDGYLVDFGNWTSGQIDYQIDLSGPLGTYNYTLVITDLFENIEILTIMVTIQDTIAPIIIDEIINGAISWMLNDGNPSNYMVYKDGKIISSGSWLDSNFVTIAPINLEKDSSLNYTIVVTDTSGNISISSVLLFVIDEHFNFISSLLALFSMLLTRKLKYG